MFTTNIEVLYVWSEIIRSNIVTLPIFDPLNAYAWLKMHYPQVEVLDTRKSNRR
jgi:hypothetical protein